MKGVRFHCYTPHPAGLLKVYKARVRRTGALVAVKVQRPDAFRSAAVDMYLLRCVGT